MYVIAIQILTDPRWQSNRNCRLGTDSYLGIASLGRVDEGGGPTNP